MNSGTPFVTLVCIIGMLACLALSQATGLLLVATQIVFWVVFVYMVFWWLVEWLSSKDHGSEL